MYRTIDIADSETCFNCIDDETDSFGNYDSLFGRNKQKKAEKKVKKAEKALAKGQLKKAAKKMKKAAPILNKIQQQQQNLLGQKLSLADINKTKEVISATDTRQTESPYTTAGQIGEESGSTTYGSELASRTSAGGTAGDISSGAGGGDYTEDIFSTASDGETSTELSPKELSGVTVKAKKDNYIMIALIAGVIILAFIFLPKLIKK